MLTRPGFETGPEWMRNPAGSPEGSRQIRRRYCASGFSSVGYRLPRLSSETSLWTACMAGTLDPTRLFKLPG
jgi:hypothetical protein